MARASPMCSTTTSSWRRLRSTGSVASAARCSSAWLTAERSWGLAASRCSRSSWLPDGCATSAWAAVLTIASPSPKGAGRPSGRWSTSGSEVSLSYPSGGRNNAVPSGGLPPPAGQTPRNRTKGSRWRAVGRGVGCGGLGPRGSGPGERPVGHRLAPLGVDVRQRDEVLRARLPQSGGHVGRDPFGAGRPGDDAAHPRLDGQPTHRHLQDGEPPLLREGLERLDAVPVRPGEPVHLAGAVEPAALRSSLSAFVLAGEQAVGEGEVGDQADADAGQRREQLLLGSTVVQRVLVLRGDERAEPGAGCCPVRVDDLPGREVRAAQIADLAFGDQLRQRLQGLLDRGDEVRLVQLVEVDVVGAQPPQAGLDGPAYVAAGGTRPPVRAVRPAHVHAELRGEHDVVAALAQRRAEDLLTGAATVGVRGVEQGDARVESGVDDGPALLRVDAGAEGVRAQPDRGHHEAAAAERAVGHVGHGAKLAGGGNRDPVAPTTAQLTCSCTMTWSSAWSSTSTMPGFPMVSFLVLVPLSNEISCSGEEWTWISPDVSASMF